MCISGCEECGIHNIGECFIHGGTLTIAQDNVLPSRAVLSLPDILTLKNHDCYTDWCEFKGKLYIITFLWLFLGTCGVFTATPIYPISAVSGV